MSDIQAGSPSVRRTIDHAHPLIYTSAWPARGPRATEFLDRGWDACPPAVRKCFAYLVADKPELLEHLARRGIPALLHADVDGRTDAGTLELFANVIGHCGPEYPERFGWPGIPRTAEATAASGGLVLWQFLFNFERLLDSDEAKYAFYREHRERIVLEIKANGFPEWWQGDEDGPQRFGRFVHYSECMFGAWLTGLAGNWGFHPEVWQWFETGYYGRLFDWSLPGTRFRGELADRGMYNTTFHNVGPCGYPENLMAQELLNAAIHGCCVFSFEHGAGGDIDTLAVMPVLEEIVSRGLIPSRREAMERVRAAVWTGQPAGPRRNRPGGFWPDSFRNLYATTSLFLQNDGRYGLIPHLPRFTPPEQRRRFECFPTGYRREHLPFLNALYPREGAGSCYIERQGSRWYVWNPCENVDRQADFDLPLYASGGLSLSGQLGSHCLAIVEERDGGLDVFLSNFRRNKDEFWDRRHEILMGDDLADVDGLLRGAMGKDDAQKLARAARLEIQRKIDTRPVMSEARTTTLRLSGCASGREPEIDIDGHEGFTCLQFCDAGGGGRHMFIQHNGIVRVKIEARGSGKAPRPPQALSRNLAMDRPVEASSAAPGCPAALAVDGLNETFWQPRDDGPQWLAVDLGEELPVSAVKLVGRTVGRVAAVEIQLAGSPAGPWTTAARLRVKGEFFRVWPVEASGGARHVRVLAKPGRGCDFQLGELGVYTGPNEELKRWMPVVEPRSAFMLMDLLRQATSDAERSAVEDALVDLIPRRSDSERLAKDLAGRLWDDDHRVAASAARVLGRLGEPRTVSMVEMAMKSGSEEVRRAACWALVGWPEAGADRPFDSVRDIARTARDLSLRSAALRWLLRSVETGELSEGERDGLLAEGMALAADARDRLAWVTAAGESAAGVEALRAVASCMDDRLAATWLLPAARAACVRIAERLIDSHRVEAREVLLAVLATVRDGAYWQAARRARELLARLLPESELPPPLDAAVSAAPGESQPPPAPSPEDLRPGIRMGVYQPAAGSFRGVDFARLAPLAEQVAEAVPPRAFLREHRGSGLWVRFDGLLKAPADGVYLLCLRADGPSSLELDGREVLAAESGRDGLARLDLAAGMHPLTLLYRRGPLEVVSLRWLPACTADQADDVQARFAAETGEGVVFADAVNTLPRVPAEALWHVPAGR